MCNDLTEAMKVLDGKSVIEPLLVSIYGTKTTKTETWDRYQLLEIDV